MCEVVAARRFTLSSEPEMEEEEDEAEEDEPEEEEKNWEDEESWEVMPRTH